MQSSARYVRQIMAHIVPLCATDGYMLTIACGMQEEYLTPIRRDGLVRCAQRTHCALRRIGGTLQAISSSTSFMVTPDIHWLVHGHPAQAAAQVQARSE
jgi:hypothetical protein